MPEPLDATMFFPYMLPSLATFLTGVSLAIFSTRRGVSQRESRLFAIVCILVSMGVTLQIAGRLGLVHGTPVDLSRFVVMITLFIIPLGGHFINAALGRENVPWLVRISYAATGLFMLLYLFAGLRYTSLAVWFAIAAAALSAFDGVSSDIALRGGRWVEPQCSVPLVLTGIIGLMFIVVMDIAFSAAFEPLGFAFIPLIIISAGLFGHGGKRAEGQSRMADLAAELIVALALLPVISDIIVLSSSLADFSLAHLDLLKAGLLAASAVSLVVCAGIAIISHRKAMARIEAVLVTVMAILVAVLNLRDILMFVLRENLSIVVLMNDIFLAMLIGANVHLSARVSGGRRSKEVAFFYVTSGVMVALMLIRTAAPADAPSALFATGRGVDHYLFIAVGVASLLRSCIMLVQGRRRTTDPVERKTMSLVLSGMLLVLVLVPAGTIMSLFDPSYTLNSSAFIYVSLVAYGVFNRDMSQINPYMRRQILATFLRSALIVTYIVVAPLVFLLLKDLSADYVLTRIVPYGIPPLLSFISAAFLSLFVLGLEKNRTVTLPFSIICFCYAALNLDILLVGIVPDVRSALMISRIDHFFLALLLLGSNLHLVYLITERKDHWWVVYLAYAVGLIMAPLALTDRYFQGMYTYYWGYFAHKDVLYDLMSALWMSALCYAIYMLFTSFRKTETTHRRNLRNVCIAFLLIAALSLTNTPAIYGFEIYPLGTFIFIALFFLTYGLFKFNLTMALQYVRSLLFWTGLVVLLIGVGIAPGSLLTGVSSLELPAGILLVAILYTPLRNMWDAVVNLFIRKTSDVLNDRYQTFTASLSHIHHLDELHAMVKSWVFEVFDAMRCTSVFFVKDRSLYAGWASFNDRVSSGLFGKAERHEMGDQAVQLQRDDAIVQICTQETGIMSRDMVSRMLGKDVTWERGAGNLEDTEIILPIRAHDALVAVFLVGGKADGSRYSMHEMEILRNAALFLGPHVENAKLLETLEQEVHDRTKDLNQALVEAMTKERQIIERNAVIERQNQVMAVLLETSTGIHHIEGLDELFAYTLSQLKGLFPDLCGGIILEGSGRHLLEASAFVGLSEPEQKIILENRNTIAQPDIDGVLKGHMERMGIVSARDSSMAWRVFPLQESGQRAAGHMILIGKDLDGPSGETIQVFIAQISAVVQIRLLLTHLERMASTDGLTGVYNRSFLDRELDKAIKHARRFMNMWFSLMIVDVNGLKQINDTYGHSAGDTVIVKVAGLLRSACRETDIVSRIGGDEFAVLMPSTNRIQADILHARIRQGEKDLMVVLTPSAGMHINIPIRISIGLASSDEDDPDMVMKVADDLMYEDKQRFYAERASVMTRTPS